MAMLAATFVLAASMALSSTALTAFPQTASTDMASHAQAAHEAEQRGDFAAAAHEYEYLTHQLPRSAEMESNLGVALYFNHQWEPAIAAFRKAIALNLNLLAPHLFSGLAWYQLSRPDAAVPELETAVRLRGSDVIARTWLGYAYTSQSRYDAAAKQFEAVCRMAPDNIDAWYALGQAYLQIGQESTVKLLTVAPNGGRAWQLAGEQYQLQQDRKNALEEFQQANARRPDIAELRTAVMELGGTPKPVSAPSSATPGAATAKEDALYAQAHAAEQKSRNAFEHVLSIAPDSYRAHQIMADAFVTEQQDDKAIAEYRIVLNLKPDLPGIHEAIGSALLRSGKPDEALQEFEAELRLQPRSADVNAAAGQALFLLKKDDEAEKALKGALLMDRPSPDIYRLLGKVELHRQNYQQAVDYLTHYVSIRKDDGIAYYLLSRAYRGLNDREQMNRAVALYQKFSQDAKARSKAATELERLNNQNHVDEETVKNGSASANPGSANP